jgi:hypothetical protein
MSRPNWQAPDSRSRSPNEVEASIVSSNGTMDLVRGSRRTLPRRCRRMGDARATFTRRGISMGHDYQSGRASTSSASAPGRSDGPSPGKRTLVETAHGGVVQRKETGEAPRSGVHAAAERGTVGPGGPLPHAETIQRLFGRHDVSGMRAHTDGAAQQANRDIRAKGFATGNHVAFDGALELHTAAHEAAHVVQQRAGVHLKSGVGEANDAYERHADAVADRVVAGQSVEGGVAR